MVVFWLSIVSALLVEIGLNIELDDEKGCGMVGPSSSGEVLVVVVPMKW